MPLAAAVTEQLYLGDGVSTGPYVLSAEIEVVTDLVVTINGVVTTAYTVSGIGNDAGVSVTFGSPPANGAEIVLARVAPYDRTRYDYQLGNFKPDTVDADIDRVVMLAQQLATALLRVPQVARGKTSLNLGLTPEANKLIGWSADALSLVNLTPATITPSTLVFSAIGQLLAVAATQAAGRSAIGATSSADVSAAIAALPLQRNLLVNGGMMIDQRKEGAASNLTAASGTVVVDRWFGRSLSAPSGTLTAQRIFSGTITDPPYSVRLLRSAGTYVGSLCIEQLSVPGSGSNPRPASKTITVSALVRKGSAFSGWGARLSVITGTGAQGHAALVAGWAGQTTGSTTILAGSLTTSYQPITLTVTLSANANQFCIRLEAVAFSGSGAANDYLEFTEAQVEYGSSASAFDREDRMTAAMRCFHYYEKSYSVGVVPGTVTDAGAILFRAAGVGGVLETMGVRYRTPKSSFPVTVTIHSPATGASGNIRNTTAGADVLVSTLTNQSSDHTGFVTIAAAVANNLYSAHYTIDGEAY